MADGPETLTFRNQLEAMSVAFVAAYKRRDARACSAAYAEDAVLLVHGSPPIRGRSEIAAAFQTGMDAGVEITGLTTLQAEADGRIGYALQTVHSNRADGTVLLTLRGDGLGNWLVSCEAAPDG